MHIDYAAHAPQLLSDYVHKMVPEMRIPPLIRTLEVDQRVSGIEGFHCIYVNSYNGIHTYIYTKVASSAVYLIIARLKISL